jgi:hypothetical protein
LLTYGQETRDFAKEANMRRNAAVMHAQRSLPLPRGWIIMGAALAAWAFFLGASASLASLFSWALSAL